MVKARTKDRRASPDEFASLMEEYGLRSNDGAKLVAEILLMRPLTVQKLYTKGILRTELGWLRYCLSEKRRLGQI